MINTETEITCDMCGTKASSKGPTFTLPGWFNVSVSRVDEHKLDKHETALSLLHSFGDICLQCCEKLTIKFKKSNVDKK